MKSKSLAIFVSVLIVALLLLTFGLLGKPPIEESADLFVGVDVAYDDLKDIKRLVREISSYTNTFVIGSSGITYNVTRLDEICEYVYDREMYFMIYLHPLEDPELLDEQRQWVEDARIRWGQRFLGLYAYDEVGGNQMDQTEYRLFEKADNYTDAADKYTNQLKQILRHTREDPINSGNLTLFTSDYVLYWFDYKAGYDVVFAEFGWNNSRQLNVALDRGAATVQNKEWGVMITWTYNHPPHIESGEELYEDMILAYNNGAKYILVFDTNKNHTEGILEKEHLEALEQFWQYTQDNARNNLQIENRVAFVLPKGYGYGFRGPNDRIWGLWEADSLALEVSQHLDILLEEYGTRLDIIYDDEIENNDACMLYSKYIFWNGTIILDAHAD
ncbi:MAG: hypothetical protein JSV75_01220 [Candidatus Bathyarchaeota archaeon]|nr:MAG: hypothetical protein JSV75_01220 [Candidatus Bathyarchaeota archaeon]